MEKEKKIEKKMKIKKGRRWLDLRMEIGNRVWTVDSEVYLSSRVITAHIS